MLTRSSAARYAASVFYEGFNDIDIYVEDTGPGVEKFYSILIQRAINERWKVNRIFPIGNYQEVINRCAMDQGAGGRTRVYLVDGDLRLICKEENVSLRRLVVLTRYCIENYLIDQVAVVEIAFEEHPNASLEDLLGVFQFEEWIWKLRRPLIRLFALYAVAWKYKRSLETVGYNVRLLVKNGLGELNYTKVKAREVELENELLGVLLKKDLRQEKSRYIRSMRACGMCPVRKFASGKDYLFPLLLMRLRSIAKIRAENVVLKNRLAMKADIAELRQLLLTALAKNGVGEEQSPSNN